MTKLHEILAVEADKEGIAKRMMGETQAVFKNKHNIFSGMTKTLQMDAEGQTSLEEASREETEIVTTVPERLDYTTNVVADWLDVCLTKEATNYGQAKADLVVDGVTLATDVPATFLLGLESKLKQLRNMYDCTPTLAPDKQWIEDLSGKPNTYVTASPEIRTKTQKVPQSRVLYEATQAHPAQIEKWIEEQVVGKYTTISRSGMLTSARKAEMLGRVDKLIQATKQARMRANDVEIVNGKIGSSIFDYING